MKKTIKLYNQEGPPNSKEPHFNAQKRMYDIVQKVAHPYFITLEKMYPNPFNRSPQDSTYDWKFDLYFESDSRKIVIEVDDKHKLNRTQIANRTHKIKYLKTRGIELFAWKREWIIGKKSLDEDYFLKEMGFI